MTAFNEYGPLTRVAMRSAAASFGGPARIAREWGPLNFTEAPDFERAVAQHDALRALLVRLGAGVEELALDGELTLDSIYVRDAAVITPAGAVLGRMGKAARAGEPAAQGPGLQALGCPVVGAIEPPGLLEGGDVVWFDDRTVAVGRGYRTNDDGIRQLRKVLGAGVEVVVVPLPHYRGPSDVFHLMSIVSPVDRDLAVVHSPLMPVPFREWLCERGFELVEVPVEEFDSMGSNVLAVGPRRCVMLEGNPVTQSRLEAAGAEVFTYDGSEISVAGGGGPTCLTRPLARA